MKPRKEWLEALVASCGYEPRSYSGRGMYGRECLAFTIGSGADQPANPLGVVAEIVAACPEQWEDELIELFQDAKTDQMGLGTVIYFPGVGAPPEEGPDHYEEDDDDQR